MQFTLSINQVKSLEWGLNSQQALLFAFVYSCPSWTTPVKTENGIFFALSKAKIVEELPLLTDKPDTAYRMLKALEDAGLIDLSSTANITLFRLTKKAAEWNKKEDGSEKYPTPPASKGRKNIRSTSDKSPSKGGKKSEQGSDKSPTNQDTSNQDTNQDTSHSLPEGSDKPTHPGVLALVVDQPEAPRVEIPADMPGPKDQACKTFKAWANYAMAYRRRYQCWPVWNAAAGGMLGKLVDSLGIDVAHSVAAYYLTVNDARIVNDCHSLKNLIGKADAYHTMWLTGRQMNSRTARQIEDTQANMNAAQEAARAILDGEKRNAFL